MVKNDRENKCGTNCENGMITYDSAFEVLLNIGFVNVASKLTEPIINSEFELLNTFVQAK